MTQFAWLWIATLILKLLLSGILPLAPDEAYYWVWSHHFQLSYYDHPPFVAWLFAIAQPMESIFSIVRWPAVLLGHLAFWFWLPLFRNILSGRQLLVWAALWLTSPLTGPGSMVVTPDLPLLFFWPLALWALLRTLETRSIAWASLLGLALGLGFCSKYHMGLFGILAIAWLTWERKFSRDLVVPILACVVFFFIFSSPVWIWNAQNDFVSFKFQMNHGLGGESWKPFWTWSYVLGQILLLFPLVSWAAANGLRKEPLPLWLKVFAIGPLLFFFATSFKGKVEANWPIVAYPFVFAIASRQLARWQVWSTSAVWMGIL